MSFCPKGIFVKICGLFAMKMTVNAAKQLVAKVTPATMASVAVVKNRSKAVYVAMLS